RRLDVLEVLGQSCLGEITPHLLEVRPIVLPQPARDTQPGRWAARRLSQQAERLGEDVQRLLGTDACEIANCEGPPLRPPPPPSPPRGGGGGGGGGGPAVASKVEARPDNVDALARNLKVTRHEIGVIVARADKAVDAATVLPDQVEAFLPVRLGQGFQVDVIA